MSRERQQKITLPDTDYLTNCDGGKHRKENNFYHEMTAIALGKDAGKPLVTARFYTTDATTYCCLWIHAGERWYSGSGKAGGYGYHRASEALDSAFRSASCAPAYHFGGGGDYEMRKAIEAAARALGYRKFIIHEAHA